MPFEYAVDAQRHLLTITGTGSVSMQERYACVSSITNDPGIDRSCQVLIDVSGVANQPASHEIQWIAALIDRLLSRFSGRVAIVNTQVGHVTTTHLIVFSAGAGPERVNAFLTEQDAHAWLLSP